MVKFHNQLHFVILLIHFDLSPQSVISFPLMQLYKSLFSIELYFLKNGEAFIIIGLISSLSSCCKKWQW